MKTLLVGIGAAGNKAVMEAVSMGVVKEEDTLIINSTSKDFPKDYKGKTIVLTSEDTGCGKERSVAKSYALSAISSGKLNNEEFNKYTTIVVCTSVEGGTGSGSTPIIAQFFNQVYNKNVHIIAFTGFEEDVRGLANTVDFFKEVNSNLITQTISNQSFMTAANKNKFAAEKLANKELAKRFRILTGQDFIDSEQNIDDTDILKVSNTSGYTTIEKVEIKSPLVDEADFNKYVKRMLLGSHSILSDNPSAIRLGIILNLSPESEDAVDYNFTDIKARYGNPYESFMQKQWDESQGEYIAIIASGMQMPLEQIESIYERYKEQSAKVNKTADEFYEAIQTMEIDEEDRKFDMIKPVQKATSVQDFMKQFETK